jgi:large subunit ribosomal protein L23
MMYQLIKKPIVSEKNSVMAESGVYVFEIDRSATKVDVKKAIEKLFKVKVLSVNTAVCRSRAGRSRTGVSPVRYWKKALVKLAPGEKIALFEGA